MRSDNIAELQATFSWLEGWTAGPEFRLKRAIIKAKAECDAEFSAVLVGLYDSVQAALGPGTLL